MDQPKPGQKWRAKKNPAFVVEIEIVLRKQTMTSDEILIQFTNPEHVGEGGTFPVEDFQKWYEPV